MFLSDPEGKEESQRTDERDDGREEDRKAAAGGWRHLPVQPLQFCGPGPGELLWPRITHGKYFPSTVIPVLK